MNHHGMQHAFQSWSKVIRKGKLCSYCGSGEPLHAHHILPKIKYPEVSIMSI